MRGRWILPLAAAMVLVVPAGAEAATVGYLGKGIKSQRMTVGFFLKDRNALKRLSFRSIPMRCPGGRRYRIDGRRFGEAIRVDRQGEFSARGRGRFPSGVEIARVRGKVRVRAGRARGVLQVSARRDNGSTCRSGEQPWRARRA